MESLASHALAPGSVWISENRCHQGYLRLVKKVRANTVRVESVGCRQPRQHRNRRYTIPIDQFLRKHTLVKPAPKI